VLEGLTFVLLAWAFIQVSCEMVEGDTQGFDMMVVKAAQTWRAGHPWVAEVMRDLSGTGSTSVLVLVTSASVGYLALSRAWALALVVATAVITGAASVNLLKAGFARARPAADFAQLVAPGLSFPSGHAGVSAIVFLTLGALVAATRDRSAERMYILSMAGLMTLLVGVSRIALGVHWPSDVVAGWAFGAAWAMVWLLIAHRFARGSAAAKLE
jgi:undecaprenyl-diphosphatase